MPSRNRSMKQVSGGHSHIQQYLTEFERLIHVRFSDRKDRTY